MPGLLARFRSNHSLLLLCTGAFAWLWLVARACVQSIVIDEADTFLMWVARNSPAHWQADSNNHVLNSALMRLSTSVFGASPFTLRLPALLGAALYIAAVYFLVRFISGSLFLQWSLFVCLVFNPFVMDYLVAARGYSLALAFLALALALAARFQALDAETRSRRLYRTAALISVAVALSFCANFSFGVADLATSLLLLLWIGRERPNQRLKALAAFVLPGLALVSLFAGATLLAWPKGQLTWGVTSLLETGKSVIKASLFEPNPYLLPPPLRWFFERIRHFIFPLLGACFLWRIVALARGRAALTDPPSRRRLALAALCGASLVLTLCGHQVLYSAFGILLPLSRTALYTAPLCLLMGGAAAAVPLRTRAGKASGAALTAALGLVACYSLGCLRLTYFQEWQWDADVKNIYSVLSYYNHTYGVTRVSAGWRYVSALNCYRALSGRETLREIPPGWTPAGDYPAGVPVYVLYQPDDQALLTRERLKTVYQNPFTGAAVAIRPEVESASPCPSRN